MENCLFRVFSHEEYMASGYIIPSFRHSGYSFNQKAFTVMAKGYKDAAEMLAETQTDKGERYNDGLLYPIFFCYRHAFELMLKAVIMNCFVPFNRGRTSSETDALKKVLPVHKLSELFSTISNEINRKGYSSKYSTVLSKAGVYVDAFNVFDCTSYEMRYPADKLLSPVECQKDLICYDIQYTLIRFKDAWSLLQDLYLKTEEDWAHGLFVK